LSEVIDALKDQQSRAALLFDQATPQQLDAAAAAKYFGDQSVRTAVIHGLLDEAAHFGEVYLLRKLWRAAVAANGVASQLLAQRYRSRAASARGEIANRAFHRIPAS
jgi:hypothetical protein